MRKNIRPLRIPIRAWRQPRDLQAALDNQIRPRANVSEEQGEHDDNIQRHGTEVDSHQEEAQEPVRGQRQQGHARIDERQPGDGEDAGAGDGDDGAGEAPEDLLGQGGKGRVPGEQVEASVDGAGDGEGDVGEGDEEVGVITIIDQPGHGNVEIREVVPPITDPFLARIRHPRKVDGDGFRRRSVFAPGLGTELPSPDIGWLECRLHSPGTESSVLLQIPRFYFSSKADFLWISQVAPSIIGGDIALRLKPLHPVIHIHAPETEKALALLDRHGLPQASMTVGSSIIMLDSGVARCV